MLREEMIAEISMKRDIPMEDVEEVLEEEDIIVAKEIKCKKRKKCLCFCGITLVFLMGAAVALYILDKKQKIDIEEIIKKYSEKMHIKER